jgi:hypothetical protein
MLFMLFHSSFKFMLPWMQPEHPYEYVDHQ